ncbi:galactose-binding domain-like protein [Schizophyllum amplum]|uniref:Galactose-binding domain-like protein n=1 Tax=Schizophyllum amplum TaxID=97359 RepID=A0A550CJG4_9AGAR|nr:galactose-binding domain-like protein [Auriculariopsis ampla]
MATPATIVAAVVPPPPLPGVPVHPGLPPGVPYPPQPVQPNARFLVHTTRYPPPLPWPDISEKAKWSVSSFKFGFGAECLVDGDPETFWHSDGPQPHFITIEFQKKVAMQKLSLFLSFNEDDSYTPATIEVRAGTGANDLQSIQIINFDKPDGWITFDIGTEPADDSEEDPTGQASSIKPVYAYVVQIAIIANHMSGKDTHVRGLRVLGIQEDELLDEDPFPWVTTHFKWYETLR